MRTLVYEGVVTAQSSIIHNGFEKSGNIGLFRREAMLQPNGKVENVPVISGNSVRGILRDKGMLYMLSRLGYGVNNETGQIKGLPLSAFYFLLSGGSLGSTGESGLNLEHFRRIRHLLPLVSVFGGAQGNAIMPGRLKVGKMIPIVKQTMHLLPERFRDTHPTPPSFYELMGLEAYNRTDDAKNDTLAHLIEGRGQKISQEDREYLQTDLFATEEPRKEVVPEKKTGTPQQMLYEVETLVAGTQFYWRLELNDPTDLEIEALISALLVFSTSPHIGGKSSVGHGMVGVKFDNWIDINPRANLTGTAVDFKLGDKYHRHLETEGEAINTFLKGLK